jgi:peptide/nickel transport system substrate-binding protein
MPDKVLRVGILAPVRTLDPREARETVSTMAVAQVYETGCHVPKADGPVEPLLLEAPVQDGPLAWSAGVRPGILFSDGTPLTAELAAASLSRAKAVADQASVEARGGRVLFKLRAPNPRFPLALTLHQCAIALEKGAQLLGTGPYVPAPGATIEKLRLVRNPHHRTRPAIDEIVFDVYPPAKDGRPEALLEAIGRGEVDFTNTLSRTDAGAVAGMRKLFQPANSTAILFFNTERPELASPATRRALAQAVDRMAVAQLSYANALAFVASGLLPPMMGAFRDDLAYDLNQAKARLAAAPAPRPARLKLMTVWAPRPYLPNPQPVAELVARQLGALGLDIQVTLPASSDEFYRACLRGAYDLLVGGWIADTPDPADFLEAVLRSDRLQTQTASALPCANRARFRSPEMDAALQGFREDPAPARRAALLQLLIEQMPVLPLMYGPSVVVNSWKLTNLEVNPLGVPNFGVADL